MGLGSLNAVTSVIILEAFDKGLKGLRFKPYYSDIQ